ncbi:ATP-binding protein [Streptomyces shenzhenensis]|uniref:hypothetical protein n=1 Tax=Streptomyces shenzhenensis TaxID=943815 RepID=UPI0015F117DD|nr:hypothetical protein [Streptomyces shenzhenensis]
MTPPNQQPDASTSAVVGLLTDTAVNKEVPTTTITLLPLRQEEKPAFEWSTSLLANEGAGPNARLRARPWLTIGHWPGNVDIAARVADKLVDNAVRHGRPFTDGCVSLHLIVTGDTRELLVEVDDANPEFPDFETVANQSGEPIGKPTGLWWVAHYRGRLSWDVKRSVDGEVVGKTVQAILPLD